MGRALEIRDDLRASELRAQAAREKKNRVARRMLAIANALDGMSRADAARAAGMDRQALRDAVVRYNAEGLDGLHDRPMFPDASNYPANEQIRNIMHLLLLRQLSYAG